MNEGNKKSKGPSKTSVVVGLGLLAGLLFGRLAYDGKPKQENPYTLPQNNSQIVDEPEPQTDTPKHEFVKEYKGNMDKGIEQYLKDHYNLKEYTFDTVFGQSLDASKIPTLNKVHFPPKDSSKFDSWYKEVYGVDYDQQPTLPQSVITYLDGWSRRNLVKNPEQAKWTSYSLNYFLDNNRVWNVTGGDKLREELRTYLEETKLLQGRQENELVRGKWEFRGMHKDGPLYLFSRTIDPCIKPTTPNKETGYAYTKSPHQTPHQCDDNDPNTAYPIKQKMLYLNGKIIAPGYLDVLGYKRVGLNAKDKHGHIEEEVIPQLENQEIYYTLQYCNHDNSELHGLLRKPKSPSYCEIPTYLTLQYNNGSFKELFSIRGFLEVLHTSKYTKLFTGGPTQITGVEKMPSIIEGEFAQHYIIPQNGKWVAFYRTPSGVHVNKPFTKQLSTLGPDDIGVWPKQFTSKFINSYHAQGRLSSERESSGDPYNPNYYTFERRGVDKKYGAPSNIDPKDCFGQE